MKQCPCGKYYLDKDTVCPFCGYKMSKTEWKEHLAELKAQRKAEKKREKTSEEIEQERTLRQERRKIAVEYERKRALDDKRIVSAVLISTTNRRSALGTVARATIGGALFGFAGTIGGAASTKSEATHATFSVKYASGRVGTETVEINSKRFKELSALLHK